MKKILLAIFLLSFLSKINAQKAQLDTLQPATYIHIFTQQARFGSPKNNIWLVTGKKLAKLKTDDGKEIEVETTIEAFNMMDTAGWEYVDDNTTDGKMLFLFRRRR
jgi:hypothetical protein